MVEREATRKDSTHPRRSFNNAILLMVAQVAGMPLSLLNNVIVGRYLGADALGLIYLVVTIWGFGILVVEWGQSATVTAAIAKAPGRAGVVLGTGLVWRLATIPFVYALLAAGCAILHQGREMQMALAIVAAVFLVNTVSGAAQDALRGFERLDVPAKVGVYQQLLGLLVVGPVLILTTRLRDALLAQVLAALLMAAWVWWSLRRIAPMKLGFDRATLRHLLVEGSPFVALSLSLALQPNVDALLLAKLAPPESLGWLAAARRLVGVLVFPASALATAFYPAWVRLWNEDKEGFERAVSTGLRATTVLVAPVALGCALYPDIGVSAFSHRAFGPAETDLRVLSLFVVALFFSMLLSAGITAAGRSRAWAVCQLSCVVVSTVLDPLLVPYCQTRFGNGSLGVCASTVVSEAMMVAGGAWLIPGHVFDRRFARTAGLTVVSGLLMTAVAFALSRVSSFVAAPIAVATYGVAIWVMGGVAPVLADLIRESIGKRLRRRAATP
jgi:O-antigen/teichoic acid export membrane protein